MIVRRYLVYIIAFVVVVNAVVQRGVAFMRVFIFLNERSAVSESNGKNIAKN